MFFYDCSQSYQASQWRHVINRRSKPAVINATSPAYKQAVPPIADNPALYTAFMRGKRLSDKSFVATEGMGYAGLGPAYIRKSCIACHPTCGGHGKRVNEFNTDDSRNSYLLMICDLTSPPLALASKYFTGMTQTCAVSPFKLPVTSGHSDMLHDLRTRNDEKAILRHGGEGQVPQNDQNRTTGADQILGSNLIRFRAAFANDGTKTCRVFKTRQVLV